jgi:RHS repeat-associated protein
MIFRSTAIAHIQKGKSAIAHKGSNGGAIASYGYSYDAANRINRMTTPDGATTYRYDQRNQLLGTDSNYQADEAYEYDANGDRTGAGYQSEGNNRLASDGVYTYSYDDEGNLTLREAIADNSSTTYEWDNRNRLVAMSEKDSNGNITQSMEYRYDVFNRRIAKVIDADGAGNATPQVERLVYNGDDIALTFDGNGVQTHRYLYGVGVDAIAADESQGQLKWALSDHLGSVRDVVDSSGVLLNHIVYDSHGQVVSQSNPLVDVRYGYTGRDLDSESGLNYYRARYYDAATGRFISEDPIGFGGGDANLYRYVRNFPLNATDPSGNNPFALLQNIATRGVNWTAEKAEDVKDFLVDKAEDARNLLNEHGGTIRQVDRAGRFIRGAAEDPAGAISDLAIDIASDEAYSVARDSITQAAEEAVQFYIAICNDPETPEPVRLAAIAAGSMASLATEENFDTTHQVLTLGLTANDFI